MGRLVIDGNSVFEIDEECIKRRKIPDTCDIEKYLKSEIDKCEKKSSNKKEKSDG